jgi:hypothetical protein
MIPLVSELAGPSLIALRSLAVWLCKPRNSESIVSSMEDFYLLWLAAQIIVLRVLVPVMHTLSVIVPQSQNVEAEMRKASEGLEAD